MSHSIEQLSENEAIAVLKTVSDAKQHGKDYETEWTPELSASLMEAFSIDEIVNKPDDGELAKSALQLIADDKMDRDAIEHLVENPPAEAFGIGAAAAIGVCALIALQTHVVFERTSTGKVRFKIEKKPTDIELLKSLAEKIYAYFTAGKV